MRITPFGRYGVCLLALSFVLALGVGRGASSMMLVAAGFFVLAYESMRRPMVEQGLSRTPWFVPRLVIGSEAVRLEGLMMTRIVRYNDIVRARLVYQEELEAMMGIDDALCLETPEGVLQVPRCSEGFDALMARLRHVSIGVLMVRARAID